MKQARILVTRSLQEFVEYEASGGIVLVAAAVAALAAGNSPLAPAYSGLWDTYVGITAGGFALELSLLHWINDGLMAVFFFLVGLEIKREILVGELSSVRKASLPIIGAVGGALLPALLYLVLTGGPQHSRGWGIPMATDIAFVVGVLALLGSRAPVWLKAFLVALAIADDLMAVLVIAVFYTADLDLATLWWAAGMAGVLLVMNRAGARSNWAYVLPALGLWYAVLQSGVHATVAGVVAAAFVPVSLRDDRPDRTASDIEAALARFARAVAPLTRTEEALEAKDLREDVLQELAREIQTSEAPLYRMEHALHPWVAFGVVPLFAFANAGVAIPVDALGEALTHPVTLGVALGLFFGKQIGITGATWLAVRLGVAELPEGARWRTLWGGSLLAGIGFTMSIFIASLAFSEPALLDLAKIGIVAGSLTAGLTGWLVLRADAESPAAGAADAPPSRPPEEPDAA